MQPRDPRGVIQRRMRRDIAAEAIYFSVSSEGFPVYLLMKCIWVRAERLCSDTPKNLSVHHISGAEHHGLSGLERYDGPSEV
jgi:hypothetical protein